MKVLVTGANGFVGSHIVEALLEQGHSVVCLIRATSNLRWLNGLNVEYRLGDVTMTELLPEIVRDVDVIVHSAGVLRAIAPEGYYEVNQHATRNLAAAVLKHNPALKKFVFISSQAAMGPSTVPSPKALHEPANPVSDYGKSKLAGERELELLRGKIPFTILRPAAVYGPRDKDLFILFNLVHAGFRPLPLTKRMLQLCFVRDIAAAAAAAVTHGAGDYGTYVIADPVPYSWNDIGTTIASVINKKTFPILLPDLAFHITGTLTEGIARLRRQPAVINRQKVGEMLQSYWIGDVEPASKDLRLDFTKLEFGAKITYLWYKENDWL